MGLLEFLFLLIPTYGLIGLFASAFFMSLVFVPIGIPELLVPVFVYLKANPYLIFFTLLGGALLADLTNFHVGKIGAKFFKIRQKEFWWVRKFLERIEEPLEKWGHFAIVGLASLPPPFPFSVVGVLAGFLKMDRKTFLLATALGKGIKYGLIVILSIYGVHILLGV